MCLCSALHEPASLLVYQGARATHVLVQPALAAPCADELCLAAHTNPSEFGAAMHTDHWCRARKVCVHPLLARSCLQLLRAVETHIIAVPSDHDAKEMNHVLVVLPIEPPPPTGYPVMHYIYAGPELQLVPVAGHSSQFDVLRYTQLGMAVVVVDVCGSANRSRDYQQRINGRLVGIRQRRELAHITCAGHRRN
jgi:hypothetical protein